MRLAHGKEEAASLDDLEEILKVEGEEEQDPSEDALLTESGKILLDFIGLTPQVALVERTSADADTTIQ